MKINSFLNWLSLAILMFILQSCSIENRMTRTTIQKEIKTKPEFSKGKLYFENDYAVLYFDSKPPAKYIFPS